MAQPLDAFIPRPDARERFEITVRAPAHRVFETASRFDIQSIALVHGIFRLRELVMRARPLPRASAEFFEEMNSLGWATLVDKPGELHVAGAACQPWLGEVKFAPVPAEGFRDFAEPDRVKIAWTVETLALATDRTRLATETRVVATEPGARRKFLRYWRWARFGILPIRWLLLPAIGRQAERAGR